MNKLLTIVAIPLLFSMGTAHATCTFYEKVPGVSYSGNPEGAKKIGLFTNDYVYEIVSGVSYSGIPEGAKKLGLIEGDKGYEKVSGVSFSGNPEGAKHVLVLSGCTPDESAAALLAHLAILKKNK